MIDVEPPITNQLFIDYLYNNNNLFILMKILILFHNPLFILNNKEQAMVKHLD
jgi:hypothetical protein